MKTCTSKFAVLLLSIALLLPLLGVSTIAEEPVEISPTTVDVRPFESNLTTTPTIVSYINTKADFDNVLTNSPATAMFYINTNGDITDIAGSKIATLDDVFVKTDNKVIAGFIPEDKQAVTKLVTYLKSKKADDVMLATSDKELAKYARTSYKTMRTAIIIDENHATDNEGLMQIREDVNASLAKIAILPYNMAKKELVSYLQERLITVWVSSPENETEPQSIAMILSGANGIVVSNRKQAEDCFTKFEKNSFSREIYIIGHRGVPSVAPENTIEGSVLAAKFGAQIIENDIYITKDNVIVVLHDGALERTTTGTGNIENYTYDELKDVKNKLFVEKYPDIKIPTLEDYFKEFKDKDTILFVEIKSGKQQLITELARLVEEYDFYDQMSVISFNGAQLINLQKVMPGMSMGYLCSGITSNDPLKSVKQALASTQSFNSTFNQSYGGMTGEFLIQASHRGMTVWPWTYRDRNDLNKYFMYGTFGLTTDYAQWTSQTVKKVVSESYDYDLTVGETKDIGLTALQYNNKNISVATELGKNAEVVMLWGEDLVTRDGIGFTAKTTGEAAFYVRYKTKLMKTETVVAEEIYMYSPVIRLTVNEQIESAAESTDSVGSDIKSGIEWYIYVIIIAAVAAVGVIIFLALKKGKK